MTSSITVLIRRRRCKYRTERPNKIDSAERHACLQKNERKSDQINKPAAISKITTSHANRHPSITRLTLLPTARRPKSRTPKAPQPLIRTMQQSSWDGMHENMQGTQVQIRLRGRCTASKDFEGGSACRTHERRLVGSTFLVGVCGYEAGRFSLVGIGCFVDFWVRVCDVWRVGDDVEIIVLW